MGYDLGATSIWGAAAFPVRSLDHLPFDVLPFIPRPWLDEAMQRLAQQDIDLVLRQKRIPIAWTPTHTDYVVVTEDALLQAEALGISIVGRVHPSDYRASVKRYLGPRILDKAVFGLLRKDANLSASKRFSVSQKLAVALLIILAMIFCLAAPLTAVWLTASLVGSAFFAIIVLLRLYCLLPQAARRTCSQKVRRIDHLPVYTVLVPVFRETAVLDQLLGALLALDYPADRLDIKLILEENDTGMQIALARHILPPQFDIVIVPTGSPQTKPRALNYALSFARGSLVTIYDSEDLPLRRQLRVAAQRFAELPDDVACLQAALVFYNAEENWLTRQFAAEYATLFKVVLPALAKAKLPLLLGGTSNHFRMEALVAVGGWDAFNVTEDADLGIRLSRMGYATGVVESETFEEANTAFFNWMKQRRRWLKGFLQTWLVHMRHPLVLLRELGVKGFAVVQCMTIGIFASALLHPMLLAYSLWKLTPRNLEEAANDPWYLTMLTICMLFLILGYVVAMVASVQGLQRLGQPVRISMIVGLPFYWLMMSMAAWQALWDFVVRPFHWHKTQHGLSRLMRKNPEAPDKVRRRPV